jgi:hypothetical protein
MRREWLIAAGYRYFHSVLCRRCMSDRMSNRKSQASWRETMIAMRGGMINYDHRLLGGRRDRGPQRYEQ